MTDPLLDLEKRVALVTRAATGAEPGADVMLTAAHSDGRRCHGQQNR